MKCNPRPFFHRPMHRVALVARSLLVCLASAAALLAGHVPALAEPLSANVSYGGLLAENESLGVLVVRAGYTVPLGATWRLSVDYPMLGRVDGKGWFGDSQSATKPGVPLVLLQKRRGLSEHLSLQLGAGITPIGARVLTELRDWRPPEHVSDFVIGGDVFSVLSAQADRWAFRERWVTLVFPFELRYEPGSGAFGAVEIALDVGTSSELEIDLRATLRAGYRTQRLQVGARLLGFAELVHQLGRSQTGELDFTAGQSGHIAFEPFAAVCIRGLWLRGRLGFGHFTGGAGVSILAAHLDVGQSF